MPSSNKTGKKPKGEQGKGAKSASAPQARPLPRTFETRGA